MKHKRQAVLLVTAVAAALAAALAAPPIHADAGKDIKKGFQEVGEGFKKLGQKVGEGGKEAGLEIAEAAKKIFYKGKKVSAPLLRDVQRATKKFWDDVLDGMDDAIDKLQDENDELKREVARAEKDQ